MQTVDDTWRVTAPDAEARLRDYILFRRHLFAYRAAASRAPRGSRWLDVGCGLGYALGLLRGPGRTVVALDLSRRALGDLPPRPGLARVQADALRLPFAARSFDVVTAFQLLEHFPLVDAVRLTVELRRVLRPGGRAFLTTPNARWRTFPGQPPPNPFHVFELRPDTLRSFCRKAGIPRRSLYGVIGLHGAQAVERLRAPRTWAGLRGRVRGRLLRALHRPERAVTEADRRRRWFRLSRSFARGLDFFLELRR